MAKVSNMKLLDLPTELFQNIIHILIKDNGVGDAFKYRLTCKMFAREIYEDIIVRQDLANVLGYLTYHSLFIGYGPAIFYRRLPNSSHEMSIFIKKVVRELMDFSDSDSDTRRDNYAKQVCNAFSAIDSYPLCFHIRPYAPEDSPFFVSNVGAALPAAAAAIGDLDLLRLLVTNPRDLFVSVRDGFPNAFCAAVACNQKNVVDYIMQYTTRATDVLTLETALQVAIRTSRLEMENMILDFILAEHPDSIKKLDIRRTIENCIEYGDAEFFLRLLQCRKTVHEKYVLCERDYGFPMAKEDVDKIFLCGSRRFTKGLFANLRQDPKMNALGPWLPLDLALSKSRYDLARMVLDSGANIDMRDRHGDGSTALQFACKQETIPNVMWLIENGADISTILTGERHPWDEYPIEMVDLCEAAARHANGRKLNRDEWHLYWCTQRQDIISARDLRLYSRGRFLEN